MIKMTTARRLKGFFKVAGEKEVEKIEIIRHTNVYKNVGQ